MNIKLLLIIINMFIFINKLIGSTFYVAPFGNDSYTTTQAQIQKTPWRTISHAASLVIAGDSIIVKAGTYNENNIEFKHSGTNSDWIVITSEPGTKPVITGNGERGIYILGNKYNPYTKSHFLINGLTFHGYKKDGISIYYSKYIICTNIHSYDNGNTGINVVDSDYIMIQDSRLHHNGWKSDEDSGWGDGISINNHKDNGKTSVVRRNIIYANWQKRTNSYWDGNGFTLDMAGDDGVHIVAHNIIFNNGGAGFLAGNTGTMWIFHNIFFRNMSDPDCRNLADVYLIHARAHDTRLKNNIIYTRPDIWTIDRNEGSDNAIIENNLIWGEDRAKTGIWWLSWKKVTMDYWISNRAPGTLKEEPDFISVPYDNEFITFHGGRWIKMDVNLYDFKLRSSSPCIDAGEFLTKTTSSGTGTDVEVGDVGYFSDGFGMIDGDYIKIGSNNLVKIVHIDYQRNVITLESEISWNRGDYVHSLFYGLAPDIGAYEFYPDLPPTGIISLSQSSPLKSGQQIEITLTTSKTVIKNPSVLSFIENDSTFTDIKLTGAVPGVLFTGKINIDSTVAEGIGYFALQEHSLVDKFGNKGNIITQGNYLTIDKTAPVMPKKIKITE